MNDVDIEEFRDFAVCLIHEHIDAELITVDDKSEIYGKIGISLWSGGKNQIKLLRHISENEVDNYILALGVRGHVYEKPELREYASLIDSEEKFVEHLVLHEVAHIKNNWGQEKETDCDLWACENSK